MYYWLTECDVRYRLPACLLLKFRKEVKKMIHVMKVAFLFACVMAVLFLSETMEACSTLMEEKRQFKEMLPGLSEKEAIIGKQYLRESKKIVVAFIAFSSMFIGLATYLLGFLA